jgi:hypothetical protein
MLPSAAPLPPEYTSRVECSTCHGEFRVVEGKVGLTGSGPAPMGKGAGPCPQRAGVGDAELACREHLYQMRLKGTLALLSTLPLSEQPLIYYPQLPAMFLPAKED